MTEYDGRHAGSHDGVLTDVDLKRIKDVACACPHGMTAEDVFKLRGFLEWWENLKSSVGGYVIKGFLALIVAIGILLAWITQGGSRG